MCLCFLQRDVHCPPSPIVNTPLSRHHMAFTDSDPLDHHRLFRWVCHHLWVFIILGVLQIILAFLMVVIYFSIRTLTSSLELVETIPSYASAVLVSKCFQLTSQNAPKIQTLYYYNFSLCIYPAWIRCRIYVN